MGNNNKIKVSGGGREGGMDGWTYDFVELSGLAHQLLLEAAVLLELRWLVRVGERE